MKDRIAQDIARGNDSFIGGDDHALEVRRVEISVIGQNYYLVQTAREHEVVSDNVSYLLGNALVSNRCRTEAVSSVAHQSPHRAESAAAIKNVGLVAEDGVLDAHKRRRVKALHSLACDDEEFSHVQTVILGDIVGDDALVAVTDVDFRYNGEPRSDEPVRMALKVLLVEFGVNQPERQLITDCVKAKVEISRFFKWSDRLRHYNCVRHRVHDALDALTLAKRVVERVKVQRWCGVASLASECQAVKNGVVVLRDGLLRDVKIREPALQFCDNGLRKCDECCNSHNSVLSRPKAYTDE